MKTTTEDFENAAKNKKGVRFGNSTTYQVDGDDSPKGEKSKDNKDKKVIDVKDLSDARDEKEKVKALIEKEDKMKLEEAKMMTEWKRKQAEKDGKSDMDKMIDKIRGETKAVIQETKKPIEESYTTDDFDEISNSASLSASKSGTNYTVSSSIPKKNVDVAKS